MTGEQERRERMARVGVWLMPLIGVVLVVVTALAPLAAIVAFPVIFIITIRHVQGMARTSGSIAPYATLLALDMLMLVAVAWLFLNR